MNSYLTGIISGGVAMVLSVVGATWYLSGQIAEVRQDVAVVKVKVEGLSSAAIHPAGEVQQAQYVLVELSSDQKVREETIRELARDVLTRQGK